jgi:hypothetical protein
MRYVGLGLWNSVAGTLILETVLYAAGVLVYVRSTTARDRIGSVGVWMFVIAIYAIYLANAFGPPPPDGPLGLPD